MNGELFKRAVDFINENKRRKIWFRIGSVMAAIVVFVTTYALILPAITMENKTVCGLEEHTHMYDCYEHITEKEEKKTVCSNKLPTVHKHGKSCYDKDGKLICGYADYIIHEHTELCYDKDGKLICTLEEHKKHEHTDECYETKKILICGKDETAANDAENSEKGDSSASVAMPESGDKNSNSESSSAHTHNSDCYKEEKVLVCDKDEVTPHEHTKSCYDEDGKLVCGKLEAVEHQHTAECFETVGGSERNVLICKKPEHKHSESCYASKDEKTTKEPENNGTQEVGAYTKEFDYEDSDISMKLNVESGKDLENAELKVSDMSKLSAQYRAIKTYAKENESSDSDKIIAKTVTLKDGGKEIDASEYKIVAEVTVKDKVIAPIKKELSKLSDAAPDALIGVEINPIELDGETLSESDGAVVTGSESTPAVKVNINNGTLVLRAAATANPKYTVQYYANLHRFATSGSNPLVVIDTSGGVLPKNNQMPKTKNIYLTPAGGNTNQNAGVQTPLYKVMTTTELNEIYTNENYEYIKSPNPSYVNKLIDNSSYNLKEIWVLKSGKSSTSTNRNDWNIYGTDIHFTNRAEIAASDIIYITDNTVIRFVYDCSDTNFSTPATFYDYNISSGQNSDGKWRTGTTGINIESNYSKSTNGNRTWRSYADVLAFGNANCGTGMANYKFGGGYLNRYNLANSNAYGCNFGLAKSLNNGKIVYNDWLCTPKLFNDGSANGKQTYDNSALTFKKVGDTYTLSSATLNDNGSKTISNLQNFFNPSPKSDTTYTHIFTNNFWPMDKASKRTDPLFGSYNSLVYYQGFMSADGISGTWSPESTTFPYSDDGNAHNSFFGLQYSIGFELTEDYVGPLEYLFYGDDDMWVFLDNKLVCDIGGVHSSVGEYVNLWDYLQKGVAGKHTLSLFYTERGASGSTCYMNFTLPSVSGVNIEQKATSLKVQKEVVGENDPTKEFGFSIRFFDSNGSEIKDDYAYVKYDKDGNKISNDLVIHDGSDFTLKNGEYIVIEYLPFGIRYTVTETGHDGYTVSSKVNGIVQSGSEAKGTIIKDAVNQVLFTNTIDKVGLKLQKLDYNGTPLTGAVFELKSSDGSVINFVKNSDGSYTVPTESNELLDTSQKYYIALNSDESYVMASLNDKTVIQKKTGSTAQQFQLFTQADGSVSIRSCLSNKWLDHDEGKLTNGTLVHFWSNENVPSNSDIHKWYLILNSDGSLKIKPRLAILNKSVAVLDLNTGVATENQKIQIYEDNGTVAQKWKLVPVNPKAAPTTTTRLEVGSDSVLNLSGMFPGTYTLTEITAPYDHKLLTDPIQIKVGADSKVTVVGSNSHVSVDSASGLVLKVKNDREDQDLTIEKEVIGSSTTQSFKFTVSYTIDGKTTRQTVSLSGGKSSTLKIPYGAQVTVTEANSSDFVVAYKSDMPITENGSSCSFTMTQSMKIKATNTAAGIVLPATGGHGTYMYTIAGAVLILTALTLMYKSKKSRKEKFGDLRS